MKTCLAPNAPSPGATSVKPLSSSRSHALGATPLKCLVTAAALTAGWVIYSLITVLLSLNQILDQMHQSLGTAIRP